jgi:hypothetical protein
MAMKNIPDRFGIATSSIAVVLGWFAIDTILAEALTPKAQTFAQELARAEPISGGSLADWAAAAALRGDLVGDIAMARAVPALNRGNTPEAPEKAAARERALATARASLSLAPHSSAMWLLVAMLLSQTQTEASVAAVLKMSYLTSSADANLIPTRLAVLAVSPAIADPELQSLLRSDIRLILTRRPDLKAAIASAYRDGSPEAKATIDEVVRSIDPGFAASLL